MKRVVQAFLALAFLVFAVLALFVGRPGREAENLVDLSPRTAAAVREEATLRNVTKKPIVYTIMPGPYGRVPRTRTLAAGALDRIAADLPVEISFDSGRRTTAYLIHPGKPYSFRYDENDVIRVYPGSHGLEDAADLAPFVPTPPEVVERMLEIAAVGPDDVVYDLGCGDGRMVIAAARTRGCRAVGIELDAALIEECKAAAEREGVTKLVRFLRLDATKASLTEATVLALYLLPESLETLSPAFERDLRAGARIVSHDYKIPGWDGRIVRTEVLPGESGRDHRIILYRMPEKR
ncbi:MAG: methyltransferase domain-containing protein [Candidatus Aminicenantes bacterium]|nr:MAG: methyltransferase domain-containing protein [Candidatus Aminicenantes bacterium]